MMEKYKNLSGKSGVAGYEIGINSITVQFVDGSVYLYGNQSTSAVNIERMKSLAATGKGLNGFIGRVVKKGYESKLR